MKTLIIYTSFHHKNTEKIAQVIASVFGAKLVKTENANKQMIEQADLIGLGSGVYFGKFDKNLINLVKKIDQVNKKSFIFSTCGTKNIIFNRSHKYFQKTLKQKGFKIIDEFISLGYDNYSFLKLIGGINKGRPNQKDLKDAEKFAKHLQNYF